MRIAVVMASGRIRPPLLAAVQRDPTYLSRKFVARLKELYDRGGNHQCPCCNRRCRTFLPYLTPFKPNVVCPKCGSHERHRLLWLYLKNRTDFFSAPLQVLHFAPEPCFKEHFTAASNLLYVSTDIEMSGAMVQADITRLPFQSSCFDVILCLHVLEHVSNDTEAMIELFRILKPGGWAIVQVPIDKSRNITFEDPDITSPEDRERAFGQYDHVRLYGLDYRHKLANAGFSVTIDEYVKELPADVLDRYGLDPEEDIYVLNKSA
jgi:SAM-dependent methyltransferase